MTCYQSLSQLAIYSLLQHVVTNIVTIAQLLPIVIIPIIVIIPTVCWNYLYLFLNIFVLVVELMIIFEQKIVNLSTKSGTMEIVLWQSVKGQCSVDIYTIISTVSII